MQPCPKSPRLSIKISRNPTINTFHCKNCSVQVRFNKPPFQSLQKCPTHPVHLALKPVLHHQPSFHSVTNQSFGHEVKLADLSIPQLSQLQKQLSSELEGLSN